MTRSPSSPTGHACCGGACGGSAPAPERAPAPPGDHARLRFRIDAMDCPTEEGLIRKRLGRIPGIVHLDFNLLDRELTVHHRLEAPGEVAEALVQVGMAPVLLEARGRSAPPPVLPRGQRWRLAWGGAAALAAELVAWKTGHEASPAVAVLAAASLAASGLPTLRKGWIALRNRAINIHFLMSLATAGALAIGKWPEAAMVIFLFGLAEAIEGLSLARARDAIRALTALAPETAEVPDGDGWREAPLAEVPLGARIRVRTGARVPLDARVLSGQAALDQAPITGESLPVDKGPGDPLYAGSIVTDGVLEAEVTAAAGAGTLDRIAAAIQEAQAQRAPMQRFVDRFAHVYTPAVVVLAGAVALLGPLLAGGGWAGWLYQAIVLLVIACPCALVVSTPVTVVSGLAAAARHGVLVKGGAFLENGRRLKVVALDKTGTLTQGRPALVDAQALDGGSVADLLRIAASLDEPSTHPVARALVQGWRDRQPGASLAAVADFSVLPGRGVRGRIDGETWHLGNHRLVEELGACDPALEARLAQVEEAGRTAILLCSSRGPEALFALADTLRPESRPAVDALRGLGVTPVLLTGDNPATARAVARQLGISDARGNLMPEDKQAAIADLQAQGLTGMVGDGVNDAPALARADLGFAMGAAGTATALETADVAIMDDDPRKIADFIGLSHRTALVLRQNLVLALGIKAAFLLLAFAGRATLWMAVFADMGASLLVVANGLRLMGRFRGRRG
ncbi:heavy metal translocating P-type ATPase [Mesoterricola sediminis]|uniref:P-type Zn(2+) transporter n=1 Tax=Mesoterricola sediminis TaxID=2927980 RepID=A0AA48GZB8_9BACT|nr:heavy metal translocating P-type ATPase [Mesoterricola sediminis]BDU78400.1 metal-transporting P-type ATPase [Mesoterricola sediminis]